MRFLFFIMCLAFSCFAEEKFSCPSPDNEEEAFFLRRIAEFWEEGEFQIVKMQVEEFLQKNIEKSNAFNEFLYALLGNLYLNEKKYQEALALYSKVKTAEIKDKIHSNYLECLYQLKDFSTLIEESKKLLASEHKTDRTTYLLATALFHKKEYKEAKAYFENLIGTEFENEALEYLASTNVCLKNFKTSADMYLSLAEKFKNREEEFLFQSALLQSKYDKETSISSFNTIWKMQKERAYEALYNKLLLLLEREKYKEIRDVTKEPLDYQKAAFVYLFVGKACACMNEWQQAHKNLDKFLSLKPDKPEEIKLALLTLLEYAKKTKNRELFNAYLEKFELCFQKDESRAGLLFERALLQEKLKLFDLVKEDFNRIEKEFPSFANRDIFLFEKARLFYVMKEWDNCHSGFELFVQTCQDNRLIGSAWHYLINCSIKKKNLHQLITDINNFLKVESLSSEEEKAQYLLLLAQTKFNLKKFEETLIDLQTFIQKYPKHNQLAEAMVLMAFCYKNQSKDVQKFLHYSKEALKVKPQMLKNAAILASLANAFSEFAKNDEEFLSYASDYLFKTSDASTDILLWVSDYYYNKVKDYLNKSWQNKVTDNKEIATFSERAINLKEKSIKRLDKDISILEPQILKLARLYGFSENHKEEISWLEKLDLLYQKFPKSKWEHAEEAAFNLALVFEKTKDFLKAYLGFSAFIEKQNKNSALYPIAMLHKTRLSLSLITIPNRNLKNPALVNNLIQLKNLLIQKKLETEPVHLEAALDYIDLQCELEKAENRSNKRLFLLNRIRDAFNSKEGIVSEEYHKAREQNPEKNKIFEAYMQLINAEIAIVKANKEEAEKLISIVPPATAYLQNRLEKIKTYAP